MDNNNPFLKYTNGGQANQVDKNNPFAKYAQGGAAPQQPANDPLSNVPQGSFWDALSVMNRNFASVANGQLQSVAQGLEYLGVETKGFQQKLAELQAAHDANYQRAMQNSPIVGTVADIGSSIGAAVATPGAQPFLAAGGAAALGERLIGAGTASGVVGGSQYIPEGSEQTRLGNTVEGALLGTVMQGAGEAIGAGLKYGAGKLFNNTLDEAAIIAQNPNVKPTTGLVTGNEAVQNTEGFLSSVPVIGTRGALKSRADQLKGVTSDTLDDLGVGVNSKVNLGQQLEDSINSAYKTATINTNKAYEKALDIAEKQNLQIPLGNTQTVAANTLKDIKQLSMAGIGDEALTGKAGQLLNDLSTLPEGQIPAKMFDTLRRKVNSTISTLARGNDDEGLLPAFKQIRSSLDDDLNSLGEVNSSFGDALKTARKTFIDEKKPFQEIGVLEKATKGSLDVDKLLDNVVQSDRPILTSKIMKQLTPEGKKTFSTAIIQKAYTNAIGKTGEGTDALDLNKFSTNLHKLGETLDALPKNEQMKIKGLQKLLTRSDYIIKSSNKSSNNIISSLISGAGVGSAYTGNLPAFLATTAGTKLVSTLLTSPSMARGLVRLAGGKLGTTATDGIIKNLLKKAIGETATKGLTQAAKAGFIPAATTALTDAGDTE